MNPPIIELVDVKKIYTMGDVEVPALNGISMKISKGEFVAIQGASGSGKSTCLNMVGCLDIPTSGKILLEGKDISKMSESDLATIRGKKIGFIFQQFNLIGTLNAIENVMLPMTFQNIDDAIASKKAKELLEMVGLGDRLYHKASELSGGQIQRVAIARALSNDPSIILADEPTGNLDSKTGSSIIDMLRSINKEQKTTFVMVTHDDSLAKKAERIIRLKDGLILRDGR
jgi:putative ABC transport system ATP-binding protein